MADRTQRTWIGAVEDSAELPAATDGRPAGVLGEQALSLRASRAAADDPKPAEAAAGSGTTRSKRRRPAARRHLRAVPDQVDAPEPEAPVAQPVRRPEPSVPAPIAASPAAPSPAAMPPAPLPSIPPTIAQRRRHRRVELRSELTSLLVIVVIGTAATLGVDALFGTADGQPPAYLLVFMALPVWDLFPRRLVPRLAATVALTLVTVTAWLGFAVLPVPRWTGLRHAVWAGEFSFGAACLAAGVLSLAALALVGRSRARTTIDRVVP